jgi:hypothetical protein
MKVAYVDTSCLVAVTFDEPGAEHLTNQLQSFDRLFSSNLLEAELRAALIREHVVKADTSQLSRVTWVYPNRPLSSEFQRVLACGYVRGADLWHVACALFLVSDPPQITFATLDQRQFEVATMLGFQSL